MKQIIIFKQGDTVKVIWSYSNTAPKSGQFQYHDFRGAKALYLKEPRIESMPKGPGVSYLDVLAPNVCYKFSKLPQF